MRPALSITLLALCFGVAGYQDIIEAERQADEAQARRYPLRTAAPSAQPEVANNTGSARPDRPPVVPFAGARAVVTSTPARAVQRARRGATS